MIQRNEMKLENWLSFYTQFSLIKRNWRASTNGKRLRAMWSHLFSLTFIHQHCTRHAVIILRPSHSIACTWGSLNVLHTSTTMRRSVWEKNRLNNEGGVEENYFYDGWLKAEASSMKYHHNTFRMSCDDVEGRHKAVNTGHVSYRSCRGSHLITFVAIRAAMRCIYEIKTGEFENRIKLKFHTQMSIAKLNQEIR